VNIVFSRASNKWLRKYRIQRNSLVRALMLLCYKEGYPSNKTLHVHIMYNGINSEFDICRNKIRVGIDLPNTASAKSKIRRMIRNLLHEFRHFIQYKIKHQIPIFSYSYRDMLLQNDRYWNAPEERDARKYERQKLKFVLKQIIYIKPEV